MRGWLISVTLPFSVPALLAYLERRAVSGVEQVVGLTYSRVLDLGGDVVDLEVDLTRAASSGEVSIRSSCRPALVDTLSERVDWLLDASWDPSLAESVLRRDVTLAALTLRRPGLRVPGTMAPYEVAVRAIVGQQISVAAATTVTARIAREFGRPVRSAFRGLERAFPTPQVLSLAPLEQLGLPRSRAAAIRELSAAVDMGHIVLDRPPLTEVLSRLQIIRGVGPWTASYVALRGLGCRDSIPITDLGLRSALSRNRATPIQVRQLARHSERWSPYRGVAAVHLWTSLLLDARRAPA